MTAEITEKHEAGFPLSDGLCLTVTKRTGDYHSQLAENPCVWDCGRTPAEAVARWISTHGKDYGVFVEWPN